MDRYNRNPELGNHKEKYKPMKGYYMPVLVSHNRSLECNKERYKFRPEYSRKVNNK